MGTFQYCLCFTRKYTWSEAPPPEDVKQAFARYCAAGSGGNMTPEEFRRFLEEEHGVAVAEGDVDRIIDQVRHLGHRKISLGFAGKDGLTLEDFHHFLWSDELNPPLQSEVHHDMTAPLSHYFIYTGHNSYLTGNQLNSDCSDVPIIKALQRGVRVIELDIWPNSTKDDIDVLHGGTLTAPVKLIKCLESIQKHAFSASPYPLVITLEDHLTADLQAKVAKMVREIFGDLLYYPDSDSHQEFPSPEALKNRIILSTKPPKEYLTAQSKKEKDEKATGDSKTNDDEAWGQEVPDLQAELEYEAKEQDNDEKADNENEDGDDDEQKVRHDLPLEYKHLITIRAGKPKGHITEALKVDPDKVRRLSLSEQELANAALKYGAEIIRFTQKNILRVYPKGTRFNSSNYSPFIGWIHGAQMVAFNMQGYGRYLWLMHGFFKANGGCGYVKKPEFLMKAGSNNDVFNPGATLPVKKTLKVTVYSGDGWRFDFGQSHFDPLSPPDFYVRVGIAGVSADSIMMKTKSIEDNWVPVWDEEFTFPLTVPELALLRIEVHEYDMSGKDDFGGQNCLPISELKPGIRAVSLFDRKGNKYHSVKLLMRFEFV